MLIRLKAQNLDGYHAVEETQAGHVIDSAMSSFVAAVAVLLEQGSSAVTVDRIDEGGAPYRLTYTKED